MNYIHFWFNMLMYYINHIITINCYTELTLNVIYEMKYLYLTCL